MKLILKDNFDRETVSDQVIAENLNPYWAKKLAEILNRTFGGETSPNYYFAAPDDYKPHVFLP